MGFACKKTRIKFCPFCGNSLITHLHNDVFLCGENSPELEAFEKVTGENSRCNRAFRVNYPFRKDLDIICQHRKRIGRLVTLARKENEKIVHSI